ncbi:Uncharacterised protein (plasmid) [Legionella adelaidensis]|uniref:Inositolphosphotransferase Aur1/Ipt1 domain-containing protein n=1 Tax=Legionella adelaidensis TaxID=45056 RepID=A0A0W0R282_9GAMM|nr:phosphatase PAP2 family protein [Legionella adelaidensis]KTC65083.1 hypothetical protein Lade_1606 [Legionella adelaidensis]VEH85397.1 Uncharacterised protein [Legionella adelaidensis]
MNAISFWNLLLSILLCALSSLVFGVNFLFFKYPGNNYFPPNTLFIAIALLLMYFGFWLQYGKEKKITQLLKETIYFFLIMSILALTTTAAQFTPYTPIDKWIVQLETYFGLNLSAVIAWTNQHTYFKKFLGFIYDTLPFQMAYIPLLVILFGKKLYIREYYFLLLLSGLIGFTIYYFFPTTAPASIITSPFFSQEQYATGLKFFQIHHHITPSTLDGGMVALPSFHAIWAWFCCYLLREWKSMFYVSLFLNLFLILSCVLLGWHYPLDIVASGIIILLSHSAYWLINNSYRGTHFYLFK